jgi:integrase/recombinase XerC
MGALHRLDALPGFGPSIRSFAARLEGRGASKFTVAAYVADVVQLAAVAARVGCPESAALTRSTLREWLRALHAAGVCPRSRARKVAAVRSFCDHLERAGELASNPGREILLPRYARKLPAALGEEDAAALVESPAGGGALALRDRAILEILYGCGLRVSELVALNLLDVRGRSLRIWTPTRCRMVPLGASAGKALRRYLARRHELAGRASPRALMLGRRGERIGIRRVQTIVTQSGKTVGQRGVHPEVLRHSCAVHMLDRGAELHVVRSLLGHASINTTARYEAVAIGKLLKVYRAAHPMARRRPA